MFSKTGGSASGNGNRDKKASSNLSKTTNNDRADKNSKSQEPGNGKTGASSMHTVPRPKKTATSSSLSSISSFSSFESFISACSDPISTVSTPEPSRLSTATSSRPITQPTSNTASYRPSTPQIAAMLRDAGIDWQNGGPIENDRRTTRLFKTTIEREVRRVARDLGYEVEITEIFCCGLQFMVFIRLGSGEIELKTVRLLDEITARLFGGHGKDIIYLQHHPAPFRAEDVDSYLRVFLGDPSGKTVVGPLSRIRDEVARTS